MTLSETIYSDKISISTDVIHPFVSIGVGARSIGRMPYNASNKNAIGSFLKSSLCEYKAFATILMLILFQFSLYDFSSDEYVASNPHGAMIDTLINLR